MQKTAIKYEKNICTSRLIAFVSLVIKHHSRVAVLNLQKKKENFLYTPKKVSSLNSLRNVNVLNL